MGNAIKIINVKILLDGNVKMDTTTLGMQNEKNVTKLVFDIPEELNNFNKTIEFSYGNDNKVIDIISNNEYIIDNNISCNLFISFQVVFTDTEGKEVFKSFLKDCIFDKSINAVDPAPTPEEVSQWNTLVTTLNEEIKKVEELSNSSGVNITELEKVLQDILEAIQNGGTTSMVIEEIEQLIVSYFENKTVEEVEA